MTSTADQLWAYVQAHPNSDLWVKDVDNPGGYWFVAASSLTAVAAGQPDPNDGKEGQPPAWPVDPKEPFVRYLKAGTFVNLRTGPAYTAKFVKQIGPFGNTTPFAVLLYQEKDDPGSTHTYAPLQDGSGWVATDLLLDYDPDAPPVVTANVAVPYRGQFDNQAPIPNNWCLPDCIGMLLDWRASVLGIADAQPSTRDLAMQTSLAVDPSQGLITRVGIGLAAKYGMTLELRNDLTPPAIDGELAAGRPVVVLIKYGEIPEREDQADPFGHFVVIRGKDTTGYRINDPDWRTIGNFKELQGENLHILSSELVAALSKAEAPYQGLIVVGLPPATPVVQPPAIGKTYYCIDPNGANYRTSGDITAPISGPGVVYGDAVTIDDTQVNVNGYAPVIGPGNVTQAWTKLSEYSLTQPPAQPTNTGTNPPPVVTPRVTKQMKVNYPAGNSINLHLTPDTLATSRIKDTTGQDISILNGTVLNVLVDPTPYTDPTGHVVQMYQIDPNEAPLGGWWADGDYLTDPNAPVQPAPPPASTISKMSLHVMAGSHGGQVVQMVGDCASAGKNFPGIHLTRSLNWQGQVQIAQLKKADPKIKVSLRIYYPDSYLSPSGPNDWKFFDFNRTDMRGQGKAMGDWYQTSFIDPDPDAQLADWHQCINEPTSEGQTSYLPAPLQPSHYAGFVTFWTGVLDSFEAHGRKAAVFAFPMEHPPLEFWQDAGVLDLLRRVKANGHILMLHQYLAPDVAPGNWTEQTSIQRHKQIVALLPDDLKDVLICFGEYGAGYAARWQVDQLLEGWKLADHELADLGNVLFAANWTVDVGGNIATWGPSDLSADLPKIHDYRLNYTP